VGSCKVIGGLTKDFAGISSSINQEKIRIRFSLLEITHSKDPLNTGEVAIGNTDQIESIQPGAAPSKAELPASSSPPVDAKIRFVVRATQHCLIIEVDVRKTRYQLRSAPASRWQDAPRVAHGSIVRTRFTGQNPAAGNVVAAELRILIHSRIHPRVIVFGQERVGSVAPQRFEAHMPGVISRNVARIHI